jgi:ribulose-5-phosphate 4-epimerase/fuculose-1-phosphate aldolase
MSPKISASKGARGAAGLHRAISNAETEKRQSIIDACRRMNALGINQGTSGNISLRHGEGMLITPNSVSCDLMTQRALWLAAEVETLARQYHGCLQIGKPPLLPGDEIERVRQKMAGYGHAHSNSER